jgi:hypothetical protein
MSVQSTRTCACPLHAWHAVCQGSCGDAVRSLKECFVVIGILAGYLASYLYAEQVLTRPPALPVQFPLA